MLPRFFNGRSKHSRKNVDMLMPIEMVHRYSCLLQHGNLRFHFPADFLFHKVAPQVRTAWRSSGFVDTGPYRMSSPIPADAPDSSDEMVPLTVFFGADLLSVPDRPVLHALGIVASVLLDDPSSENARETRFNAVVERPGSGGYASFEYQGDACGIVALAKPVRAIWEGDTQRRVTAALMGVSSFTWPLCNAVARKI